MTFLTRFVLLFFLTLCSGGAAVFFFLKNNWPVSFGCLIVTIILFYQIVSDIFKIFRDVDDFIEAVKYRDFSRKYPDNKKFLNHFYRGFNTITDEFHSLSREKETQQQYLKRILEVVNTGIMAYETDTLDILWMNDSFKNMFQIPYIKNISWLQKRHPQLYKELNEIQLCENRLVSINTNNRIIKTLWNVSTFQTEGKTYLLFAFHNISATLEEIESGAWKSLLNVMTHEIMNSIAPVASLADTLKRRMESMKEKIELKDITDYENIESAMETIRRRSEGLLRFADTYRNLSKNFVPELKPVNLNELLTFIYQLMQPSLDKKGILLELKKDHSSVIACIDRNLIEQVLINFITNAAYAVKDKEDPKIILFSGANEEHSYLTVADNGCGIPPEIQEKMFIPFFSSKKSGTGIGLSLSREIVKMHNGSLQVQTKVGEGSAFSIIIPNDSK